MKNFFAILFIVSLTAQAFETDTFIKTEKSKRNPLLDYMNNSYQQHGIKFKARYVASKGPGYYVMAQNDERDIMPQPVMGPYKTAKEAQADSELFMDARMKVTNVQYLKGEYQPMFYKLQQSLHNRTDEKLNDCYTSQVQEVEKAMSDTELSNFFRYIDLKEIKIQLIDVRSGIPTEKALSKELFSFSPFAISGIISSGECKVTKVRELKDLLKAHIEEHKEYLKNKDKDLDAKKRATITKISQELLSDVNKRIDSLKPAVSIDSKESARPTRTQN